LLTLCSLCELATQFDSQRYGIEFDSALAAQRFEARRKWSILGIGSASQEWRRGLCEEAKFTAVFDQAPGQARKYNNEYDILDVA
jgi:hypothetical protein